MTNFSKGCVLIKDGEIYLAGFGLHKLDDNETAKLVYKINSGDSVEGTWNCGDVSILLDKNFMARSILDNKRILLGEF